MSSLPTLCLASQLLDLFSNWTHDGERHRRLALNPDTIICVELLATGIHIQLIQHGQRRQLGGLYEVEMIIAYVRALESVRMHHTTRDFCAPGISTRPLCRLTEYRPGEVFFLYEDRWDHHATCYHSWHHAISDLPAKLLSAYYNEIS